MSIIAISRGTFSGGEALAKRVAERLGYPCLSREANLETAAKRYMVPAEELTAAMEKRPSFWHRVVGERTAHLAFVRATLCETARAGSLVYHGLVGHLLLPGVSHVIRVRVIADMEARIQAAMQQQNLEHKEALAHIEKVDKERRQWIRFLFDVEWDDPHLYDLVLNLSRMSLETACETVARLTERPEFQPTAESLRTLRNLALSSRVSAVPARDPRTRDAELDVVAAEGIVTVIGTTRSQQVEESVPVVVRGVDGVKEVQAKVTSLPGNLAQLNSEVLRGPSQSGGVYAFEIQEQPDWAPRQRRPVFFWLDHAFGLYPLTVSRRQWSPLVRYRNEFQSLNILDSCVAGFLATKTRPSSLGGTREEG